MGGDECESPTDTGRCKVLSGCLELRNQWKEMNQKEEKLCILKVPSISNTKGFLKHAMSAGAGRYRVVFGTDDYMSSCRALHPGVWPPETFYPTAAVVFNCTADQVGEPDHIVELHLMIVLLAYGHCTVQVGRCKHRLATTEHFPLRTGSGLCTYTKARQQAQAVSNEKI